MFAQRIGMNASLLTQYIKATKSPSPQQEKKIINGIRRIGKELSLIEIWINKEYSNSRSDFIPREREKNDREKQNKTG